MIHQIDSKNEWLLLSAIFTAKLGLIFGKRFFLGGKVKRELQVASSNPRVRRLKARVGRLKA